MSGIDSLVLTEASYVKKMLGKNRKIKEGMLKACCSLEEKVQKLVKFDVELMPRIYHLREVYKISKKIGIPAQQILRYPIFCLTNDVSSASILEELLLGIWNNSFLAENINQDVFEKIVVVDFETAYELGYINPYRKTFFIYKVLENGCGCKTIELKILVVCLDDEDKIISDYDVKHDPYVSDARKCMHWYFAHEYFHKVVHYTIGGNGYAKLLASESWQIAKSKQEEKNTIMHDVSYEGEDYENEYEAELFAAWVVDKSLLCSEVINFFDQLVKAIGGKKT